MCHRFERFISIFSSFDRFLGGFVFSGRRLHWSAFERERGLWGLYLRRTFSVDPDIVKTAVESPAEF